MSWSRKIIVGCGIFICLEKGVAGSSSLFQRLLAPLAPNPWRVHVGFIALIMRSVNNILRMDCLEPAEHMSSNNLCVHSSRSSRMHPTAKSLSQPTRSSTMEPTMCRRARGVGGVGCTPWKFLIFRLCAGGFASKGWEKCVDRDMETL